MHPTQKSTTVFRECLGMFGAFAWFFCAMYSFEDTLFESYIFIPAFLLVLFFSLLGFGLYCGRDVQKLSRLAWALTPAGILCTAVMYLLPGPGFAALYIASGAFMGPMLLRRVYGAVEAGGEQRRFRCYFQAIALTVVFHSVWAILPIGYAYKFPVVALLAGFGWFGVLRTLPAPAYIEIMKPPRAKAAKQILFVAGAVLLLTAIDYLYTVIHTFFLSEGLDRDILLWFGGTLLPAIAFFLFAYFFDKGRARGAFLFGMAFALSGLILALIPNNSLWQFPLIITDGLGGTFTEFIIVASSVYLYRNSRRPILAASGGLAFIVLVSALGWVGDITYGLFLPETEAFGAEFMLVFVGVAAVLTLAFISLGLYLMDRQKEKNLVYAILGRLRVDPPQQEPSQPEAAGESLLEAGFTQREKEVALLLTDGHTQFEISRRLHMPSGEVGKHIKAIREKVTGAEEPGPHTAAIIQAYHLTRREGDMLRCLCRSMSNPEIAAECFLSEETVKIHVRNLMKKLPVDSRRDVGAWTEAFGERTE